MFGSKMDVNRERKRLYNVELHSLYRSPNIVWAMKSTRLRWAGHVAIMEQGWSALKVLTGKPTGKSHLGMPRRRWEDNIRKFSRYALCVQKFFYKLNEFY